MTTLQISGPSGCVMNKFMVLESTCGNVSLVLPYPVLRLMTHVTFLHVKPHPYQSDPSVPINRGPQAIPDPVKYDMTDMCPPTGDIS